MGQFAIGICLLVLAVFIGYLYITHPNFVTSMIKDPNGNAVGALIIAAIPVIFFAIGIIAIYSSFHPNFGERPRWM